MSSRSRGELGVEDERRLGGTGGGCLRTMIPGPDGCAAYVGAGSGILNRRVGRGVSSSINGSSE